MFSGREKSWGPVTAFAGSLAALNSSGNTETDALYEVVGNARNFSGGFAQVRNIFTGEASGFAFGGRKQGGNGADIQIGTIVTPSGFGLYVEEEAFHRAAGFGFEIGICPTKH